MCCNEHTDEVLKIGAVVRDTPGRRRIWVFEVENNRPVKVELVVTVVTVVGALGGHEKNPDHWSH